MLSSSFHRIVGRRINEIIEEFFFHRLQSSKTLGNTLYNEWQLKNEGQNKNNQFLIIISKKNRKFSITVGDDLKSNISDNVINEIISSSVIPLLKKGNYFEGVMVSIEELIKLEDGLPISDKKNE